ncbi:MAG: T9SS type A sorting domain-containing protein [bacterium]
MKIKNLRYLIILLVVYLTYSTFLQAQSISFHVDDLMAGPANCNWMFQSDDDPNFRVGDGNPFTSNNTNPDWNNYAYREFTWNDTKPTSALCTDEDILVLNGTGGVTLKLYGFLLKAFHHINTVDANANWDILGQAGDERIYADGIGEIYKDDVLKLKVINCRLSVSTPYPTSAQMNTLLFPGAFNDNVGTGLAVTGAGWGVIDGANSVDEWENAIDPGHTGQIEFQLSTISAVIQDNYGYFDFDITVVPAGFIENMNFDDIPPIESSIVNLPASDVSFDFVAGTLDNGSLQTVVANQRITNPGGTAPDGISAISPQMYWQIGTTLQSFDVDVTFDISDLTGVSNPSKLRILKRNNSSANWAIWSDFSLVNSTTIRANNVTSFSEFGIGSTSENPLPVELVSFTGIFTNNKVKLNWSTATEINNYGYEIERLKKESNSNGWTKIGFINGAGNSNSVKDYSYIDEKIFDGKYLYRLKQIDLDGKYEYSNQIEVLVNQIPTEYVLNQNYPNPFNPSTTISFSIPNDGFVTLKIYDLLGKEITELVNQKLSAGNYKYNFDASNLTSGIYFYTIGCNDFTSTKKMILAK